jgi:hypothetical protein
MNLLSLRTIYVEKICFDNIKCELKFLALLNSAKDILFTLANDTEQYESYISPSEHIVFIDVNNFYESLNDYEKKNSERLICIIETTNKYLDEIQKMIMRKKIAKA